MNQEIWKDVSGYISIYQVSNLGRVRRIDKKTRRLPDGFLKISEHYKGYGVVKLINKRIFVHKLVAEAFIKKRPVGLQINHKDCNKKNNFIENLEYVTQKQNMQHASKNGLRPSCKGESNPFYGKKHSPETIEHLIQVKRNMSEDTKRKMSKSATLRCKREGLSKVTLMWEARRKAK